MAKVLISESTLQNMANTIRAKTGTSESLTPSEMVTEAQTIVPLNGETISVTPSTSSQTITPSSGHNAITQVNVGAVTSSIDSNIQAENIKKDVQILGVTGSFEGGGGSYNSIIDTTVTRSGNNYLLNQCLTDISGTLDFSNFSTLGNFFNMCYNLQSISAITGTGNITTFSYMFASCDKLESVPLFDIGKRSIFG